MNDGVGADVRPSCASVLHTSYKTTHILTDIQYKKNLRKITFKFYSMRSIKYQAAHLLLLWKERKSYFVISSLPEKADV